MQRPVFPVPHTHQQLEPLEAIPSPDPFAVGCPTFPPQEDPDVQIAESGERMGQIANVQPQGRLIFDPTFSIPRRATKRG